MVSVTALIIGAVIRIYSNFKRNNDGLQLIGRAWTATYAERNMSVPPRGPRDGVLMNGKRPQYYKSVALEPPVSITGVLDVNGQGLQRAVGPPHPKIHLLIVGASVAFAQYATTTNRTYFNQLSRRLMAKGHSVRITILATRSWTSVHELTAFKTIGLSLKPDVVLFLDGLNDLTEIRNIPEEERVANYLHRMKEARDLALAHHIKVIFAPQPFLPQKKRKSPLEKTIVRLYSWPFKSTESMMADNQGIRKGLQKLTIPGKTSMMDCSGVFDDEQFTTFTDIWHFTDVGHALLAEFLAKQLDPFLTPLEVAASRKRVSSVIK